MLGHNTSVTDDRRTDKRTDKQTDRQTDDNSYYNLERYVSTVG